MLGVNRTKAALLGTAAITALVASVGTASAGGFAIREQSAQFLGSAFAGSAAGGGLSSMFWNPAALSTMQGTNTEANFSGLLLSSEDHVTGTAPGFLAGRGDSGDLGGFAVVPASYLSTQLTKDLYLGVGINSPFGLATEANFGWAGALQARTSKIFTLNVNPSVAYRVMPGVTIGAGLQVEYIKAALKSASGPFPANVPSVETRGDDTAFGFTAGIHLQPLAGTQIGIGYRSSVDHSIEGALTFGAIHAPLVPSIFVPLETPDTVTASLRQKLTPQLDFLLTGEWSNWSKVQNLTVFNSANGLPVAPPKQLNWHDGYMVSGGLEYQLNPLMLVRGGVAWEKSPVQNATERLVSLPDNDRIWLTIGGSYKWSEMITFDASYAHVFVADGHINRGPAQGEPVLITADTSGQTDILSVAMKLKWGGPAAPAEPLK